MALGLVSGLVGPATTGTAGLFGCKRKVQVVVERRQVGPEALLRVLTRCPDWRRRDDAAHDLRDYDWRERPDVALILAQALRLDPHEEVREEAAESLRELESCLPEVRVALHRAASSDPDSATRRQARKALAASDELCRASCAFCRPIAEPVEIVELPEEAVGSFDGGLGPAVEIVEPPVDRTPVLPSPVLPPVEMGPAVPLSPPIDLPPPLIDSPFSARNMRPGYLAGIVRGPGAGRMVLLTGRR